MVATSIARQCKGFGTMQSYIRSKNKGPKGILTFYT